MPVEELKACAWQRQPAQARLLLDRHPPPHSSPSRCVAPSRADAARQRPRQSPARLHTAVALVIASLAALATLAAPATPRSARSARGAHHPTAATRGWEERTRTVEGCGPTRAAAGGVGSPGSSRLLCLALRGGKRLEDKGAQALPEGPAQGCDDSDAGVTRTVDFGDEEGGDGGGSPGCICKEILAEGVCSPPHSSEYDTGNGDVPQEGDLVSIRIVISSAGEQRATTEDLLRLADAGASGAKSAKAAGDDPAEGNSITPEEACRTPLQEQYAYGGLVRVSHAIEARALPGTYSFRLGSMPDNIVPGIEEAVKGMRRGEKARITVSGDKGFGASGFHGVARAWGITLDAPAVAEVELVNWNTIDATGDGGVLVTLPHASALQVKF